MVAVCVAQNVQGQRTSQAAPELRKVRVNKIQIEDNYRKHWYLCNRRRMVREGVVRGNLEDIDTVLFG